MQKHIIYSLALIFGLLSSCQQSEKSNSIELVSEDEIAGFYGATVSEDEIANPSEMVSLVMQNGTFEGKIAGEIKEVCTKKGCWLTMDLPNGESMRVTFKDYGFFVPTNSQGFPIILDGVATLTTTDVETLQHFAEDQGKTAEEVAAITEPKKEITFEATGVIIKEKA